MKTIRILAVTFVSVCLVNFLAAEPSLTVSTSLGEVKGTTTNGAHTFMGIPYAEPPVGDLRWRATQPKTKWEGVLDATEYGAICPQPSRRTASEQDEDCLTLNIWTDPDIDPTKPMPVMVWIHGGAHVQGSGRTNGSAFAIGGVVLVSINYRLGRFGVFAHPDLSASLDEGEPTGNFHLLDQIEALKWVQREIGAFGGDPNNVTIFGVSAGGSNVNLLMSSPLSQGLFHRAIAQSGANGLSNLRTLEKQETMGINLVQARGLSSFAELKALPWQQLLVDDPTYRSQSGPIVDGIAMVESVTEVFSKGQQHDVPYIAGANSHEGSLRRGIPIPAFDQALEADRENIANIYSIESTAEELDLEFYGDMLFVGPTRYLVEQMKTVDSPGWLYHFDYVLESLNGYVPGANHGAEVRYVFNRVQPITISPQMAQFTGLPAGSHEVSEADTAMASAVNQYWIQFARAGDPNGGDLPQWVDYETSEGSALLLSNAGTSMQADLRKDQLDLVERLFFANAQR